MGLEMLKIILYHERKIEVFKDIWTKENYLKYVLYCFIMLSQSDYKILFSAIFPEGLYITLIFAMNIDF